MKVVCPGEIIAIISALRHFFTLIVYLNPNMPDNKSLFRWKFMESFTNFFLTINITTCSDYPRCNFNCELLRNIFTYFFFCEDLKSFSKSFVLLILLISHFIISSFRITEPWCDFYCLKFSFQLEQ